MANISRNELLIIAKRRGVEQTGRMNKAQLTLNIMGDMYRRYNPNTNSRKRRQLRILKVQLEA